MSVTGLDSLINAIAAGPVQPFYLASIANAVAGTYYSLWRNAGGNQGATPTVAATPVAGVVGSYPLPAITGEEKLYVCNLSIISTVAMSGWLCDRLSHIGGLVGNVATPQTATLNIATAASQGRCLASGADVDWFLEWYADTGSTATTATVNVTYDNDTTGNAIAIPLVATTRASRLYNILPNSAGQTIKQVNSVTLTATTGTAGTVGVTAYKRLCNYSVILANTGVSYDYSQTGLPEIKPQSCLCFIQACTTTSTGVQMGEIGIARG